MITWMYNESVLCVPFEVGIGVLFACVAVNAWQEVTGFKLVWIKAYWRFVDWFCWSCVCERDLCGNWNLLCKSERQYRAMASETGRVFIGKLGKWIWIICVVLCVVIKRTSFTLAEGPEKGGENNGCTNVKLAWGSKGFDTSHVPTSTITGRTKTCSYSCL